jgi:hypothetical protein
MFSVEVAIRVFMRYIFSGAASHSPPKREVSAIRAANGFGKVAL